MSEICLVRHIDTVGRPALKPKHESDMPIFMHITEGSISVTVDAWKQSYAVVAEMHALFFTVETSNE